MIIPLNIRASVRCSACGKKLNCVTDTNPPENYDVVIVVEPHECNPTPVPADKCPTCSGKGIIGTLNTHIINCPACAGTGIRR